MKDSEEYSVFTCSKQSSNSSKKKTKHRFSVNFNHSRTISLENYPTKYKINPFELKYKFENLEIEYEELFDLYTKIINYILIIIIFLKIKG